MAGTGEAHLRNGALITVRGLTVDFPVAGGKTASAVAGISFDAVKGETLGIVGESGCGKTSAGRAVMQLPPPTSGTVKVDGVDLTTLRGEEMRKARRHIQMIFQDPISSLNPARQIKDIVAEGLDIWGVAGDHRATVRQALEMVGLDPDVAANKRPHEFSGGQCQRINIARALALEPNVLICDEPVSGLDVSVQAQVLNLLEDVKERLGLTMLFVSHDLGVVKVVSDRVMVLYLGKICEIGATEALYGQPAHPYTRVLIASRPEVTTDAEELSGDIPSPTAPPSGCRFRTRCPRATAICAAEEPKLRAVHAGADHYVACHHPIH